MTDRSNLVTSGRRDDVFWYLRMLGCNSALADELTASTFADETVHHTPDSDVSEGRGRRLRIKARARFVEWLARTGKQADTLGLDAVDSLWARLGLDADANAIEAREILLELLEGVRGRAKSAIELRFCENLEPAAIGAQLNESEEAVRELLRTTMRKLLSGLLERKGA